MTNSKIRFLVLTLGLILAFHFSLKAQRTVGVKWDAPQDPEAAISQLEQFEKLGISILEVDSQLSPEIWQKIDSLQFEVYGSLGIKFPVTSTFEQPDSSLLRSIQDKASTYLSQPSVSAIGLFEYGAIHKSDYWDPLKPFSKQIKQTRQIDLYYISRSASPDSAAADFVLLDKRISPGNWDTLSVSADAVIGGYLYSPSEKLEEYLTPFKNFTEATAAAPDKPIFIHSDWLLSMLDKNPRLTETLQSFTSEKDPIFPLPKERIPVAKSTVLPIIILLLVWGTIGWHYNSSPLYRKSSFRYFFGHKFFIDDVFKRQIRSSLPAFTIILQNAFLIAACVFAVFSTFFSSLGQTAIFYHFSPLTFFGDNPLPLFIWAFLASILLSFVNIIWLSLTHRSVSSLTQITTIYAWPLQLNFIFCTIAIAVFSAGGGHYIIAGFTTLGILVSLLSFVFASMDTLRITRSKFLHLTKTIIPYLLILAGGIIWVLSKEQWMEVISLSLNLK